MTPQEIEAMKAYAAAAFGQPEASEPDVIEAGDYVRVVEDADAGDDQDMIYMQDIQAVHRVVSADDTIVTIETLRGRYVMMTFQVYLVDTDALHDEMEEMIAEEAAELSEKLANVDSPALPNIEARAQAVMDYLSREDVVVADYIAMRKELGEDVTLNQFFEFGELMKWLEGRGVIRVFRVSGMICVCLSARIISAGQAAATNTLRAERDEALAEAVKAINAANELYARVEAAKKVAKWHFDGTDPLLYEFMNALTGSANATGDSQ